MEVKHEMGKEQWRAVMTINCRYSGKGVLELKAKVRELKM